MMLNTFDLPEHKCGLSLEHNWHKNYYEDVETWEKGLAANGCPLEWINDEEREKAIKYDDVWVIQRYPDTPVGFHRLAAFDVRNLLIRAQSQLSERID
jgi:hypothetical protein